MTDAGKIGFPIVGVGASAGGLEALRELVQNIPGDSGFCYVIVQHLAPDHPSIMDQLLSSHSAIPIEKIEEGTKARPDSIFIIPAGPTLTIKDSTFHLHERQGEQRLRTPIDRFFSSLAEDAGANAFCVVLSGTGSDGTMGLRAIKAAGGFAIAQESESARFPGMPESAAATGLVDAVLKPRDVPGRLIDIASHRREAREEDTSQDRQRQIEQRLPRILGLIDGDHGHDFSGYKPGTLVRRIERRMTLLRQQTIQGYIEKLENSQDERAWLLQDFLIGVTHFFRDDDVFNKLERDVVPSIIKSNQDRLRIWVPGCATGEEVYSLAILFKEAMSKANDHRPCQLFGTDIDQSSLTHARKGFYGPTALANVSDERKERFFGKENGHFVVNAGLREMCVFAPHNLLQDPPFSRLNMISCRNLLIYLNSDTQADLVPRFHYALKPGGYLLLGPSESLGEGKAYFNVVDPKIRLFKRNDSATRGYTTLAGGHNAANTRRPPRGFERERPLSGSPPGGALTLEHKAEQFFLRECAAPYALINGQDEIVILSERIGEYVNPSKGAPTSAIDSFLARELRLPVRTAINEARGKGQRHVVANVVVGLGEGERRLLDVEAMPTPVQEGSVMVVLRPVRAQDPEELLAAAETRSDADRELTMTRRQLATTQAEYDSTEQELRSSNEELLSMNEELQSSNEELETSREELQSINEELETINAELSENNRQLIEANSDLKNLFDSTDVATLFLDSNLCVRRFTPGVNRLFALRERDLGRPLQDLAWRVNYTNFDNNSDRVMETLQPLEREVRVDATDETFVMRLRPYRRTDDRLDGCVITFFDITLRKRAERQLEENARVLGEQYAELETLYDQTPVGLSLMDKDLRWVRINERLAAINGFPVEAHAGKRQDELLPEIDAKVRETQLRVFETGKAVLGTEVQGTTPAEPDRLRDWVVDYYPVVSRGEVFAVGCCVNEVTEQKALQRRLERSLEELKESEAKLRRLFDQAPVFITVNEGPEHVYAYANPSHDAAVGHREVVGKSLAEAFPELVGTEIEERYDSVFASGEASIKPEFRAELAQPDGSTSVGWYSQILQPWFKADGSVGGVMSFAYDITELVQARERAKESEDRKELLLRELQHRVKNTLATVLAVVRFSAARASDVEQLAESLQSRLMAISRTHDVLTAAEWRGDGLRALVERELRPYRNDGEVRHVYEGPDVHLPSKEALALSLALHELATNAAKYGALSTQSGQVRVTTANEAPNGHVKVVWQETGGPKVEPPAEADKGFGMFLLEKVLSADIQGHSEVTFAPEGLRCVLVLPPPEAT